MNLSRLPSNEPLKLLLSHQTAARGLSHAYILDGADGEHRGILAQLLAAAWVCEGEGALPCEGCLPCRKVLKGIHPDIIRVGEPEKDISVGQIREMRSDAYIRPNEGTRKVYLIENAQTMNQSAQNAMLKLLEEGPAYAAFLLLTDNAAALLPTVRSRCETLSLSPVDASTSEATEGAERGDALVLLGLLTKGDELSLQGFCVGLEKYDRAAMERLFEETILLLRHALVLQAGAPCGESDSTRLGGARAAADKLSPRALLGAVDTLEKLRHACAFNAGVGHLAGWLCAELFRAGVQTN